MSIVEDSQARTQTSGGNGSWDDGPRKQMMIGKGWVQGVALVMLFSFFIMGILTYRTYAASMPELFLKRGLQQYGSIMGHGAYLGPDWTADYLRRSTDHTLKEFQDEGVVDATVAVRDEYRTNRYDKSTETLVYTQAQLAAFEDLQKHYATYFGKDAPKYGLLENTIKTPEEARQLTASAADRPGHSYSYTNNWPAEPAVDNGPTPDLIVWSGLSLVVLLGGTGILFAIYGKWSREIGWHSEEAPALSFKQPGEVSLTPAQRSTAWFFFVIALLFLMQAMLGALTEHEHPAWQRVQFDELLAQQLSLRRAYRARRERGAPVLAGTGTLTQALLARLPFALTRAQQRVANEIAIDLAQPYPMQRLLQGDVGAGKTVVAALAMLQAVESGYQAALMAPTEILAEQHYRKLAAWLEPLGHKVAWFAGSVKKREREAMSSQVGAGDTALAVGTHALIEDGVVFPRLGLAIVDEQHRFGVRQRLALKEKGQFAHQLTMSATPIPRTLAMSVYADMDVSIIDELPPGRTPIATRLISETRRHEVVARVQAACREGRQAYWVCPLIEESETLQLKTAEETYARLVEALPDLAVGLIHGRLKGEEKAAIMAAFARNEIQVLVATTVIEVGVDVPNASLMVIEHAERFGLAQLHQLRGRVGRGAAASSCILIYAQPLGQIARARLKIIYENTDGFEIARQDLQLRGPGEFVGARQSGLPLLRYASLDDTELVAQAQAVADELLQHYPEATQAHLARWLGSREELLKA